MTALSELTDKLKEIFQIDRPDLDFGIYKIMGSKAAEIEQYLLEKLPQTVRAAFSDGIDSQTAAWQQELDALEKTLSDAGVPRGQSSKYQELKNKIAAAAQSKAGEERDIYNHLLTFFSRYYEEGDFISRRRYKGDTYAVPYSGEEVLLHWANKDQYYTKSGEHFSNYRFKLSDMEGSAGKRVFFKLVNADTAKDNRKDNETKRVFMLAAYRAPEYGEDGEIVREEIVPIAKSSDGSELTVCFEYKAADNTIKQADANAQTAAAVLAHEAVQTDFAALTKAAPTEKNPNRTVLEKHLSDYTQKNSADYFIHKDLGGFLRRELDFYIKNEIMNLDNIGSEDVLSGSLNQIHTLRRIAHDLIDFLAQLENFQKKLWEKKKLVTGVHYLVTLDHFYALPEDDKDDRARKQALLDEVFANPRQREQWQNLFAIKDLPPPRFNFR